MADPLDIPYSSYGEWAYQQELENREREETTMTIGRIEKLEPSKSGKSVNVTIDGTKYTCRDFSINQLQTGTKVDITEGFFEHNGKHYKTIEAFKVIGAPSGAAAGTDEAALRFVSNVVAHAISTGKIETPEAMRGWANVAYDVAMNLGREPGEDDEPNDDIPF